MLNTYHCLSKKQNSILVGGQIFSESLGGGGWPAVSKEEAETQFTEALRGWKYANDKSKQISNPPKEKHQWIIGIISSYKSHL